MFRWDPVNGTALRLTWDKDDLTKRGAKIIDAIYTKAEELDRVASKIAGVEKGELILGGLQPSTLYSLEVVASDGEDIVATYDTLFRTGPTGKFFSNCMHCISLGAFVEISR